MYTIIIVANPSTYEGYVSGKYSTILIHLLRMVLIYLSLSNSLFFSLIISLFLSLFLSLFFYLSISSYLSLSLPLSPFLTLSLSLLISLSHSLSLFLSLSLSHSLFLYLSLSLSHSLSLFLLFISQVSTHNADEYDDTAAISFSLRSCIGLCGLCVRFRFKILFAFILWFLHFFGFQVYLLFLFHIFSFFFILITVIVIVIFFFFFSFTLLFCLFILIFLSDIISYCLTLALNQDHWYLINDIYAGLKAGLSNVLSQDQYGQDASTTSTDICRLFYTAREVTLVLCQR